MVSPDGKGNYTSIQKAIDNVPSKRTEPWLIFVANGTYEEQIIIPEDKPYIHLIGQDVDKTIVKLRINSSTEASATDPDVWKYSYKNLGISESYGFLRREYVFCKRIWQRITERSYGIGNVYPE